MATKLGLKQVRALRPGEVIWDPTVSGFGARRKQSETIAYVLKYRTKEGRQRWYTIGRHGAPWTPDSARDEAKRLLGKIVVGVDPVSDKLSKRNAKTVSELCDLYFAAAKAGEILVKQTGKPKKASTLLCDEGRIERHIKPLIGRLSVDAVTTEDIENLRNMIAAGKTRSKTKTKLRGLSQVKGGKTAATRALGLLGGIFTYAIRKKMRSDNPVRGVIRFADNKRTRRLNNGEYMALGEALRDAEKVNIWPPAIAAARFLALTGWRSGEALNLRWDEVDLVRRSATLADTKAGISVRPLSNATCDLLRATPQIGSLVFPASRGTGELVMSGFKKFWKKIAKLGDLPVDITPHTLRHSFSSVGNELHYTELTIGACIGHKGRSITSQYVHSTHVMLLAATDAIADKTAILMGEEKAAGKVIAIRASL